MLLSNRNVKIPPFKVSPRSGATLTRQMEYGLRQAIDSGFYKDGDFIPGYVELAKILGVSTAVTRRAVANLVKDGLCSPRRGIGIRICCGEGRAVAGNVLMITAGGTGAYRFYMSCLAEELRKRLFQNRILLSRAVVSDFGSKPDYSELKAALNQHVNVAVIFDYSKQIEKLLVAAGIPFVQIGPSPRSENAAAYVCDNSSATSAAVAEHCARCGVRRVLNVSMGKNGYHTLPREFGWGQDYDLRELTIRQPDSNKVAEEVVRASLAKFMALSASGKVSVNGFEPDLIAFQDDYIAQGALLAFSAANIRIPEDIQVITLANKGLGPVWLKPLTRFQVDAAAEGDIIADAVFDCLDGRKGNLDRTTAMSFIVGETTKPLR